MKPRGHMGGKKPAKPPMGAGGPAGQVKAGQAGGQIAVKPQVGLKPFTQPAPGMKELTTDRGAFKIK